MNTKRLKVAPWGKDAYVRLMQEASRLGINQSELGRRMGVTRSAVCGWRERGIPIAQLEAAAMAVGSTMEYLRTGIESAKFHYQLTEEERRIVSAYNTLNKEDREKFAAPLLEEAERIRRYRDEK